MSVIHRATAHYAKQERLIISVPEWGDDNEPLQIHVLPMTMAEVNMMAKIASKKASNIEQAANIIVVKAKDKDGKRLFSLSDRDKLMQEADAPSRELAVSLGNNIMTLSDAEVQEWKDASAGIEAEWIADMNGLGFDGKALVEQAKGLIEKAGM